MKPLLLLAGPTGWAIALVAAGISVSVLIDQVEQAQREEHNARQKARERKQRRDRIRLKLQQEYAVVERQVDSLESALNELRQEKVYWREKKAGFIITERSLYNVRQRLYRRKKKSSNTTCKKLQCKIREINTKLKACRASLNSSEMLFHETTSRYKKYQRKYRTSRKTADQLADMILQLT